MHPLRESSWLRMNTPGSIGSQMRRLIWSTPISLKSHRLGRGNEPSKDEWMSHWHDFLAVTSWSETKFNRSSKGKKRHDQTRRVRETGSVAGLSNKLCGPPSSTVFLCLGFGNGMLIRVYGSEKREWSHVFVFLFQEQEEPNHLLNCWSSWFDSFWSGFREEFVGKSLFLGRIGVIMSALCGKIRSNLIITRWNDPLKDTRMFFAQPLEASGPFRNNEGWTHPADSEVKRIKESTVNDGSREVNKSELVNGNCWGSSPWWYLFLLRHRSSCPLDSLWTRFVGRCSLSVVSKMPIRNRIKNIGLKLEIPAPRVSPRDWSTPYCRPPVRNLDLSNWQGASHAILHHRDVNKKTVRTHQTRQENRFFSQWRRSQSEAFTLTRMEQEASCSRVSFSNSRRFHRSAWQQFQRSYRKNQSFRTQAWPRYWTILILV